MARKIEPLQHAPRAGLHAEDVLRDQRGGDRRERSSATAPSSATGRCAKRRARCRRSCDLGDQLDLDAGAERQLGHAVGAARMRALLGEDLAEQLGAAVGDEVVLGEVGRAVDEAR